MDRIAQELLDGSDLRDVLNWMLREGTEYPGGQRMLGMRDLMERDFERAIRMNDASTLYLDKIERLLG